MDGEIVRIYQETQVEEAAAQDDKASGKNEKNMSIKVK